MAEWAHLAVQPSPLATDCPPSLDEVHNRDLQDPSGGAGMADERQGIDLPPPPDRQPRRSRRWVVVLVVAAVVVGLALVGTVVFTGQEPVDQAGSHVLLDEDFEGQGPYEFVEEEDAFIRLDVSDGVYDIFIKD